MTTLTETTHAGEFLISEANGDRSREKITVLSGQNLKAGAVLGAVLSGTAVWAAAAGNTGDGAMGAITVSGAAKPGVYRLVFIEPASDAGTFQVEDPDGVIIGTGVVASAFAKGGLAFTLADGGANFIAGDSGTITVTQTAIKYKEYSPANTDGSQIARAVLWDAVDASAADKAGVAILRDAEVNAAELLWFSGATADQKTEGRRQLALAGIIGR